MASGAGASFYTVAQVAVHIDKSTRRVLQLMDSGDIPEVRFGRSRRVPRARWDAIRGLSAGAIPMADAGGVAGFGLVGAMTPAQTRDYLKALLRQAREEAEAGRAWREKAEDADRKAERILHEAAELAELLAAAG